MKHPVDFERRCTHAMDKYARYVPPSGILTSALLFIEIATRTKRGRGEADMEEAGGNSAGLFGRVLPGGGGWRKEITRISNGRRCNTDVFKWKIICLKRR